MKKYNCVVSITDKSFQKLELAKALKVITSYRDYVSKLIISDLAKKFDNDVSIEIIENKEFINMSRLGFVPVIEMGEVVAWIKK